LPFPLISHPQDLLHPLNPSFKLFAFSSSLLSKPARAVADAAGRWRFVTTAPFE
jgi:hypothetical protein